MASVGRIAECVYYTRNRKLMLFHSHRGFLEHSTRSSLFHCLVHSLIYWKPICIFRARSVVMLERASYIGEENDFLSIIHRLEGIHHTSNNLFILVRISED